MFQNIIDLVYPRRCPICEDIVVPKTTKVCLACKEQLNYIKEPRCKKCSKPLNNMEQEYCFDCSTKNYHFVKGYSVWVYDKIIQKSIVSFKYHNRREYAEFYVDEILNYYKDELIKLSPDAFIPIPVHKSKLNIRGYNQAEILAKGIGRTLSIPVLNNILIRNKKTLPQKGLNDKERLRNLEQAFHYSNETREIGFHLNKVVLIDDIYTTGSTIEACTNILLKNGIEQVYFISICIGKGF